MNIIEALELAKKHGYTHASDVTYGYRASKIDATITRIKRNEDWEKDCTWGMNAAFGMLINSNGDVYNLYLRGAI